MKKFIEEFKTFISRGNVVDLAVGVVIGSNFTAIVNSLVNDIIMPIVGIFLGGINFTELKYVITPATETTPESAIRYGNFIQVIVNFLIIALVVFTVVKMINSFHRKKEAEEPVEEVQVEEEPEVPEDILLLRQIRDLLDK
ncbi:MAG: large-conductance mechanosensitive channel protein MscL [Eubacteriaceae bacterium]|nr:large-conductance mechanosensitive channel protein MscL [Eubacteriaceae bacterium]